MELEDSLFVETFFKVCFDFCMFIFFCFLLYYTSVSGFKAWIAIETILAFSLFIFLIYEVFGCVFFYEDPKLMKGETRQLRREKRKLLKLKAQKKYLETKKERHEKTAKLQCQIHELELELEGKQMTCKQCGNKIYRKSCYCPQCGVQIK